MRQFYLENEKGERKGLNGEIGVRLGNPAGLGVVFEHKVSEVGNGFFRLEEKKLKNEPFTCDLTFLPAAYARYRQLVNWVAGSMALFLIYKPYGDQEFHCSCSLKYLTKKELSKGKWLVVPAALERLSCWYLAEPTSIALEAPDAALKGYFYDETEQDWGYRYTEELRYGSESEGLSARIAPAGHEPAGLVLRIRGALEDPVIRLVGESSGTEYGIVVLDSEKDAAAVFTADDVLEISTRDDDAYIRKIAPDGTVTDLLNAVRLELGEPFFMAPTTEVSLLTVDSETATSCSATLQVYHYYWTV